MTSWNLIGFPKVGNQRNFSRGSPPEVFLGKGVLKLSSKSKGEHPCRKAILIKLQSNFIEITLQHRCSPVNLLHIFWTLFPKNISGGLLLFQKAAILEENSAIDLKENKGLLYGRCDQRIKFRFYLIPCRVVCKKPIFSYNISLANIYLFKVKNRDTRKDCEICSKLSTKTLERRYCKLWRDFTYYSGVSIVDFEQANIN